MKIVLTGNPNSGKTTLFNNLTGKTEHIGNWAGVTVDYKKSPLKKSFKKEAEIIDLPGAYSIRAFTDEESISIDFIKETNPDVLVNVIDSTNLERSLFFTTQLLELNIPVVVALNKIDAIKDEIDIKVLEKILNCSVVTISSIKNIGINNLIDKAFEDKSKEQEVAFTELINDEINLTKKDLKEIDKKRFEKVSDIINKISKENDNFKETLSDKIDNFITNPLIGIPVFVIIMSLIFDLSINTLGPFIADNLVSLIETFQGNLSQLLDSNGVSPFLNSLLTDGIIGGVGAVLGFVPLVMILMFFLSLVEDSGFMARIALIFDPLFRKIGLSGKSIIPMVVGYGCAIPGIMSTRTIKDEKQKRLTALLTPFVPCGAKVPIIALFATAFFDDNSLMFPFVYLVSFTVVIIVGLLLKKMLGVSNIESYFILELTEYKMPSIKVAFSKMIETAKDFIKKAGTIILVCNTLVFVMASFDFGFNLVDINDSILASISKPFAILFIPLGIGTWQLAAAAITGFIAKEEVVGTLATIFAMTNAIGEEFEVLDKIATKEALGITSLCAISFMFFNLFTPPCFAAMGAMKSEMKSKSFFIKSVLLQFFVGYMVSMITYQVGSIVFYKTLGEGFLASVLIFVGSILFIKQKINKNKETLVEVV